MPYVTQEARDRLNAGGDPQTSGELNYVLTVYCADFLLRSQQRYQDMNDVMGALTGALAEFQRRIVGPYEDIKARENGDVYPVEIQPLPYADRTPTPWPEGWLAR